MQTTLRVQNKRKQKEVGNTIADNLFGANLDEIVAKKVDIATSAFFRNSSIVHRQLELKQELMKRVEDLHSRAVRRSLSDKQELLVEFEALKIQMANLSVNKELDRQVVLLDKRVDKEVRTLGVQLAKKNDQLKTLTTELKDLEKKCVVTLDVKCSNTKKTINVGLAHKQFSDLMAILACGINAYITGPAGSGKTTAAEQCAKSLKLPFYFTGAISSEFKLTGFMNAQGEYVSTEFRKAYENGGLFLFDEIDGSYPQAVLAFNAALANGQMDFPDGTVKRHKNFYCIAAANTFGTGADRVYVGRNQLDAASLDRFAFIDWGYDEDLELKMSGNKEWVAFVQDVRQVLIKKKIRHIVSPRASLNGAKMLEAGIDKEKVKQELIWKGLETSSIEMIKRNLFINF